MIEERGITVVWRNGGSSVWYDSFVVVSSLVLRLNFCAKNPPLRQAANRYDTLYRRYEGLFHRYEGLSRRNYYDLIC